MGLISASRLSSSRSVWSGPLRPGISPMR
ncbi:UNVERIFIED_CONTAM: hypothetical protein GTU68_060076 [Idotea baltica]|nr:hypothetical protein [Idotea baltica]